MPLSHRLSLVALPLLALSLSQACTCDGRAKQLGKEGNLTFAYASADANTDFNRPLAEGATLQVQIEGPDGERVSQINQASSSNSAVFATGVFAGAADRILLRAERAGRAELRVNANVSGRGAASDAIDVTVATIGGISAAHRCTDSGEAAYLRGRPIALDYVRQSPSGERLVGEGGCAVDVLSERETLGVGCNERVLEVEAPQEAGPITLSVQRANRITRYQQLVAHVISPELFDFDPVIDPLYVGRASDVILRPVTQYWPICTTLELEVEILTPFVCSSTRGGSRGVFTVSADEAMRFSLRGEETGECAFMVRPVGLGLPDVWEFTTWVE